MLLSTGSWITVGILSGVLVLAISALIFLIVRKIRGRGSWREDWPVVLGMLSGFALFFSGISLWGMLSVGAAAGAANTQLSEAGFTVQSIDTTGSTAVVLIAGEPVRIELHQDPSTGQWTATQSCKFTTEGNIDATHCFTLRSSE